MITNQKNGSFDEELITRSFVQWFSFADSHFLHKWLRFYECMKRRMAAPIWSHSKIVYHLDLLQGPTMCNWIRRRRRKKTKKAHAHTQFACDECRVFSLALLVVWNIAAWWISLKIASFFRFKIKCWMWKRPVFHSKLLLEQFNSIFSWAHTHTHDPVVALSALNPSHRIPVSNVLN